MLDRPTQTTNSAFSQLYVQRHLDEIIDRIPAKPRFGTSKGDNVLAVVTGSSSVDDPPVDVTVIPRIGVEKWIEGETPPSILAFVRRPPAPDHVYCLVITPEMFSMCEVRIVRFVSARVKRDNVARARRTFR